MQSTISRRTTKTIRVKHSIMSVPAEERKNLATTLPELRRRLKVHGAVRTTPAMKRRLIAAGAWGMPIE